MHKDQKYIKALLEGDNVLIKEIYQKNARQVSSWIQKNSGSSSEANDIFQEALIAIYTKAAKGDLILTAPFGALLMRICKNKWIDSLRKKSRSPEVRMEEDLRYDNVGEIQQLTEEIDETFLKEQIMEQTFQQLSDLCQKLLKLLIEGFAPSVVAEQLQMSNANSVYRRKKACSDRWKTLFDKQLNIQNR